MTEFKNILLNDKVVDITVEGNRFSRITPSQPVDGELPKPELAVFPAFYNTHTHAAMTLLRGYADDMPLQKWLQEYIWPYEDSLTAEQIQHGSTLAEREMLSSGSVFFNDMYFDIEGTIEEVQKAGGRAGIGITVMDYHSKAKSEEKKAFVRNFQDPTGGRIQIVMAPHAIYTVCADRLKDSAEFARENNVKLHIHVAETRSEVEDCIKAHGMTPVRYLDSLGFLGPDVIAAHCVWVDREEWDILAERGVTVSHCPCSNLKMGSGRFPYEMAIASGVRMTLGTDGASSNNNLDMREEMKIAALMAKAIRADENGTLTNGGDPTLLPADMVLKWATSNGAEAFGIDAGVIAEGKLADFILVDLNNPSMVPCHHVVSNWVYAASNSSIREVWCDGKKVA